jgi:hypothetical protein
MATVTREQVEQMQVARYLGGLHTGESGLAQAFREVADRHANNAEIRDVARHLSLCSLDSVDSLAPWIERFGEVENPDPVLLRGALFHGARVGGLGLLRDLQDLLLMVGQVHGAWTIVDQAAKGLHDQGMHQWATARLADTQKQRAWLETQIKVVAPQAVIVAPDPPSVIESVLPTLPHPPPVPEPARKPLAGVAAAGLIGLIAWLVSRRRA